MADTPRITKTQYVAGTQCQKRLFYEEHRPDFAGPLDPMDEKARVEGARVGELARELFPGGFGVAVNPRLHAENVRETREMIEDPSVKAIFEAAFSHDGVDVRVDVLERVGEDQFDLVEVKSSSKVKKSHLQDVALQLWVLAGAGIDVRAVRVLHPNKEYEHPGGELDLDAFFVDEDVTEAAEEIAQENVHDQIVESRQTLGMKRGPQADLGSHCNKPVRCPFYDHCRHRLPEHTVEDLPRLKAGKRAMFKERGIKRIPDIPEELARSELSPTQMPVWESLRSGEPIFDAAGVEEALKGVEFPVHFMDFESFNPTIPPYPRVRPFQQIPFQWSNHTLDADGELTHREHIHGARGEDPTKDPRPAFITSLLDAVEGEGSIFVYYASFERGRLRELAEDFPEYADRLHAVIDRLVDLHPVASKNVYHPDLHGSFSIKKVLAAYVPEMSYDDLEIQNGAVAAIEFAQIASPLTRSADRDQVRENLLRYCERDTEAMVVLYHEFLLRIPPEEFTRPGPVAALIRLAVARGGVGAAVDRFRELAAASPSLASTVLSKGVPAQFLQCLSAGDLTPLLECDDRRIRMVALTYLGELRDAREPAHEQGGPQATR